MGGPLTPKLFHPRTTLKIKKSVSESKRIQIIIKTYKTRTFDFLKKKNLIKVSYINLKKHDF